MTNKLDTFSEDGRGVYDPTIDPLTKRVRHGASAVEAIISEEAPKGAQKPFDPTNTDTWPGREFIEKAH